MSNWLTILLSIFGVASAGLFVMAKSERSKRSTAEKRADVFEHQAIVARETAKVMHQVALERDDQLRAVEENAQELRDKVEAAAVEIKEAAHDADKIAGLWNKTFDGDDDA
jgi:hypothetical protein